MLWEALRINDVGSTNGQGVVDQLDELIRREWFGKDIDRAPVSCLGQNLRGAMGGNDDDAVLRILPTDPAEDIKARHIRKTEIGDRQIKSCPLTFFNPIAAGHGAHRVIAVVIQDQFDSVHNAWLIIDDEDFDFLCHGLLHLHLTFGQRLNRILRGERGKSTAGNSTTPRPNPDHLRNRLHMYSGTGHLSQSINSGPRLYPPPGIAGGFPEDSAASTRSFNKAVVPATHAPLMQ